jgi:hypothetical protein
LGKCTSGKETSNQNGEKFVHVKFLEKEVVVETDAPGIERPIRNAASIPWVDSNS